MKSPKTKVLKYETGEDIKPPFLVPAKTTMPQWYKNDKRLPNDLKSFEGKNIKHCVPFLDALTVGYSMVTPYDLYVTQRETGPWIAWGIGTEGAVKTRENSSAPTLPIPVGHSNTPFVWHIKGALQIPKGYSALFTHPLNQHDLPFTTLSGVVDDILMPDGNIPFFLKEGFEGLISQGTPVLQIIPFKRENWDSQISKGLFAQGQINTKRYLSTFKGGYKMTGWKQKRYN